MLNQKHHHNRHLVIIYKEWRVEKILPITFSQKPTWCQMFMTLGCSKFWVSSLIYCCCFQIQVAPKNRAEQNATRDSVYVTAILSTDRKWFRAQCIQWFWRPNILIFQSINNTKNRKIVKILFHFSIILENFHQRCSNIGNKVYF